MGAVYRVGAHGCWAWAVCLASLSPNLIRPGLAAHFRSPWSWVSLGTSGLAQPNPTPPPSLSWPHSHWEKGWRLGGLLDPCPLCPAFQGWEASIHCWAGRKKQWLPLEEVGIWGLPARVGARAQEN